MKYDHNGGSMRHGTKKRFVGQEQNYVLHDIALKEWKYRHV